MDNINRQMEKIKQIIEESLKVKQAILNDQHKIDSISEAAKIITNAFRNDKKVLFCGNGGSAADAQHLAAEFSGRFYKDRDPLFSEALHVNSSYLTAVANDYSYDEVYARLVKAKCREGDILIGISTSGNSKNIIRAFEEAKLRNVIVIAMTGSSGGAMKALSDLLLNVPSNDTPRIQECHILIGHIICQIVEENLFP